MASNNAFALARTLAVDPEVILMDELTSALDPRSTEAIEEPILQLKQKRTVVLVTHNLAQACRVADWLACIEVRDGTGGLAECSPCSNLPALGSRSYAGDPWRISSKLFVTTGPESG